MIIKAVKLLIATIGLGLGSAAIAEDLVNYSIDPNLAYYYYDAESIRKNSNNTMELWIKVDHSKNKTVSYRYQRIKLRINCFEETFQSLAAFEYQADGNLTNRVEFEYPKTFVIPPGSTTDLLLKQVCSK